jgi:hypothetical protein
MLEEMVYSKIAKEISKHIVGLCIFKFLREHEIFQLFQVVCYILWHKGRCLNNRCYNILGLYKTSCLNKSLLLLIKH